jgi:signal transduction histidine kinase/integral membrane sensor domain MASE1/CheY-like chemotaxis protein
MASETSPAEVLPSPAMPISTDLPERRSSGLVGQTITGVLVFLAYFLSAKICLRFAVNPSASAIWAPTGISLAALLVFGYRFWPAIFVGAFLANLTAAGSIAASLAIAFGNTLESLSGAWLISRFANARNVFDRARDTARFVVLAAVFSSVIAATIGAAALCAIGYAAWPDFGPIWITWWLGDAAGALIVFPPLLLWVNDHHLDSIRKQKLETVVALMALVAAGAIVFGSWLPRPDQPYPLEFTIIPILIWVAFRFGVRETATANLILAVFAIAGTLHGLGPFARASRNQALLFLQTFLGVIGITTIAVAAEVAQRRRLDEERTTHAAERELLLDAERRAHSDAEKSLAMLRRLQTVTIGLPGSTSDEILRELLMRLKTVTNADIGVVLLLDPGTADLVAVGSVGIPEPISRDFRIAVGKGVAGRIAASADGLIMNDLPRDENLSSFFANRIKSVVGAPLRLDGKVIGVIEVGTFQPHEFNDDDLALIQLVGYLVASRIQHAQLDDAERTARKAAEDANRAKDEFLAMLGHELRNPIGAISNAVHLLQRADRRPDLAAKARDIIARQIDHTRRLIDDLLDVARVTSGKIVLNQSPMDLAQCVTECINSMRATGEFLRHEVRFEASPVWVNADPDRMAQIATNLLANAVKYTPAGGLISVMVGPEDGNAQLRVIDTGTGISDELLPRIFDLFTQGERTLERAHGGLGLGLTLVKKLTERHGGDVTASSAGPGRGSTFTVTLPRIDPVGVEAERAGSSSSDANGTRRRIVVVEDNVDVRVGLRDLLESLGHEVYAAEDGPGGVKAMLAVQPNFALVDVGLPGFDGYEVARRIRADSRGSGITLIAVTGYGHRESREVALAAGFDHYLVKPIDFYQLRDILGGPPGAPSVPYSAT